MRRALAALVLLVGCAVPDHLDLESRWRPLTRLQASAAIAPGVFSTLCPVVFCHAVSDFTDASQVQQDGLLLHEQLHAIRQMQDVSGPTYWLSRYVVDLDFRWREESLGWEREIAYVVSHGGVVDVGLVAGILSGSTYSLGGRPMIGLDAARAWVQGVMARAR